MSGSGEDIASLGIKVDATQVTPAASNLDVLTAAGARTEAQVEALVVTAAEFSAALKTNNNDINAAVASLERQSVQAKATATSIAGIGSATGASSVEFRTLQQNIDASLGLTDASFKRASASAAIFSQSLQGVAAIEASSGLTATAAAEARIAAAEANEVAARAYIESLTGIALTETTVAEVAGRATAVMVEQNLTLAQSMGVLGSASVRSAAEIVGSYEAEAAASVESAATQVAAHGAISGSSVKLRESIVILREAMRGDFSRMAGSASILLTAFGLLETVLLPLLAVAAVGFAAVAIATHEINKESGDLTVGLGLNATQLARVKDRGVEMGDTLKATFKVLGTDLIDALGPDAISSIQSGWETFIGFISMGFMGLIGEANVLKQLYLDMRGEGGGKTLQQAMLEGASAAQTFMNDVAKTARDIATARIIKQAGNPGKTAGDGAVNQSDKTLQELHDMTEATRGYNAELSVNVNALGAVNLQQKEDQALKSVIAKIELDNKLSLQQKLDLINQLHTAQAEYDQELIRYNVLQDVSKGAQQLTILETQLDLLGKTATVQATILATVRAQQELSNRGYDPTKATSDQKATADAYIQTQINLAVGAVRLTEEQNAYNDSLHATSDLMSTLGDEAKDMASGLSDAFGTVGKAVQDLASTYTDYVEKQAKFAEQQKAIDKLAADGQDVTQKQIQLTTQKEGADASYYANILGDAKEFFAQGSEGYKLLQAAETAYRVYQLASSIQGIALKSSEAAASIAADTAAATAAGTRAVANAAADVPFPFNLASIATIAAVLAGFGILMSGSGGASAPPVDVAKDRQTAQGANTVLGDASAKSDSIAKSIDELAKDSNRDLEYSNQMVTSLKAIEQHIGSLTSLLAQQLQVGGYLDPSTQKLGTTTSSGAGGALGIIAGGIGTLLGGPVIGGILAGLIGSIFGSSTTTKTLMDQGINIFTTTIGQAIAGSIQANSYQTVQSVKKSSALFGLISSTKTTDTTTTNELPTEFTDNIQQIIAGLRSTVLAAASKLGIDGAQQVIDSLSVNIGTISLKDMTGDQIQAALNSVFSKLGDQLAAAIVPEISQFQQVGEGALETLSRLAAEYEIVTDAQKAVGFQFTQTGVSSLEARDRLVQLSGGLDQFTSQASFFVDNFLTTAQAIAPVQTAVNAALSDLGIVGITTKNQFAALVQSLDTSTEAGAQMYAQLMNIAPAFAKVADAAAELADKALTLQIKLLQDEGEAAQATALQRQQELAALDASLRPLQQLIYATEDLNTANDNLASAKKTLADLTNDEVDITTQVSNAHNDLAKAYQTEASTLNATITKFQSLSSALSDYGKSLGTSSTVANDPLTQYARAKAAFQQTSNAASSGDANALANFQQVSETFLTASKAASSNSTQFNSDINSVKLATAAAADAASKQVSNAQQQLDALNASVATLNILNDSVLSVQDAINNLAALQEKADAQKAADIDAAQVAVDAAQKAVDLAAAAQVAAAKAYSLQIQAANDAAQANTNAIISAINSGYAIMADVGNLLAGDLNTLTQASVNGFVTIASAGPTRDALTSLENTVAALLNNAANLTADQYAAALAARDALNKVEAEIAAGVSVINLADISGPLNALINATLTTGSATVNAVSVGQSAAIAAANDNASNIIGNLTAGLGAYGETFTAAVAQMATQTNLGLSNLLFSSYDQINTAERALDKNDANFATAYAYLESLRQALDQTNTYIDDGLGKQYDAITSGNQRIVDVATNLTGVMQGRLDNINYSINSLPAQISLKAFNADNVDIAAQTASLTQVGDSIRLQTSGSASNDVDPVLLELQGLRADLNAIEAKIEANTRKTNDTLTRLSQNDQGGNALTVVVAA